MPGWTPQLQAWQRASGHQLQGAGVLEPSVAGVALTGWDVVPALLVRAISPQGGGRLLLEGQRTCSSQPLLGHMGEMPRALDRGDSGGGSDRQGRQQEGEDEAWSGFLAGPLHLPFSLTTVPPLRGRSRG